jgi:radical SAM superfamily enzyme YgiQ (UPF0313 family)
MIIDEQEYERLRGGKAQLAVALGAAADEIRALRASVARLRAERDAARSAIRAALDGADIAVGGDGAWLDQPLIDRLRLGLERRPEAGELPDDEPGEEAPR